MERECGTRINYQIRIKNYELGKRRNLLIHTFVATEWEGEPTESEEMKPQWFEVGQVPYEQMWKSDQEWLPEVLVGKTIKAAYIYDHEGGEVVERRIEEVDFWGT